MLDWEGLFKRYVWDDRTTPYLVPVSRLKRQQADYEILAYSIFLGLLFAVVSLSALTDVGPEGRSPNISLYALSVTCAAVIFCYAKSYAAALYLSAAPLAGLAYTIFYGIGSDRGLLDSLLVALVLIVLLCYSRRIITIARLYPTLTEGDDSDTPKRRLFK
ncbi:MAG: hypothetical protein VYB37_00615 [Pseudomonadota bacterium]|jgi:hypothetical protein|nr:hypothetical protein [Pseudomonadota bacterium]